MRKVISICSMLLGFSLLIYPQIEKQASDAKQKQLVEAFENLKNISTIEGDSFEDLGNAITMERDVFEDSGNINVVGNSASQAELQINTEEDDLTLLEGARGILRIPSIDLEMVIFNGSNEASLKKGIGMIEPEKEFGENNIGLAGHRSTTYGKRFNRLDEVEVQDIIEIQTEKTTYDFEIVKIFVVDRTEIEVLKDGEEPRITLVTCTPVGKKNPTDRLIVQAKLIKSTNKIKGGS